MTRRSPAGLTLVELLIALSVAALLVMLGSAALHGMRDAVALDRAAAAVRGTLAGARSLAIRERATVRLRLSGRGELVLFGPDDEVLRSLPLTGGTVRVDSVDLRPPTLRFNSRGQAAPGSVYLYRGERGVRIVSNFLGRLREERFRIM